MTRWVYHKKETELGVKWYPVRVLGLRFSVGSGNQGRTSETGRVFRSGDNPEVQECGDPPGICNARNVCNIARSRAEMSVDA
ncbi:hypothetical protein OUZ56_012497 [Daphnia magna]|uniref:Uncharacterized protein n=1 Tax=Daphnia magna TaxID=35525 RepID=A0ABQ9Z361_9CRUS|nr:hypothetical protein OUZ56_012497 [Daphnia magna]